jgi:beta-RFAP synthase
MLSFGQADVPPFGGLGAMIDAPRLRISFTRADAFEVRGPLAERAADFVRRVCQHRKMTSEPSCLIEINEAPPEHCGLGVGTQLALAVSAGLARLFDWPALDSVGPPTVLRRGERSWVGIYGCSHGGLIFESRQRPDEKVSTLLQHASLPADWRFVLIRPRDEHGLHGPGEKQAFAELPPVPIETTQKLRRLVEEKIVPSAQNADFETFSYALFNYGRTAGLCFSAVQGGPFASRRLESLVETIRSLGVRGVGQSSWGPTLYALTPDQQSAEKLVEQLSEADGGDLDLLIAPPNNTGATIETRF